jgi:diguanylate cyclase (GGDEF)-like protein
MAMQESHILIVEDLKFFAALLLNQIKKNYDFEVTWVKSYEEALKAVAANERHYLAAIVDIDLSDAPEGAIVDLMLEQHIPCIVFTENYSDDLRKSIWSKMVVDYVLKKGQHNVDYVVGLINRLHKNKDIQVLVVDDSPSMRNIICRRLRVHNYQVLEAGNGKEALDVLVENPGILLIITDYEMPIMDGFDMTVKVRNSYSKEQLAIIGISGVEDETLSAQFIKNGANDFLAKPFSIDEFYCRINQNVQLIEQIKIIREASETDYLTGLFNRRFFFGYGQKCFANAIRQKVNNAVAMLDIDHFKSINDKFGHDGGDEALKAVSDVLKSRFRESDIVSRFGGEEFCILACGMEEKETMRVFENLRKTVEAMTINTSAGNISLTVSIGLCDRKMASLDEMVNLADANLYQAKGSGRNRVVLDNGAENASVPE